MKTSEPSQARMKRDNKIKCHQMQSGRVCDYQDTELNEKFSIKAEKFNGFITWIVFHPATFCYANHIFKIVKPS